MSKKGILWGLIAYLLVWFTLTLCHNLLGIPDSQIGVLLILCQVLAGIVAAKVSSQLRAVNSALAGVLVGLFIAGWVALADGESVGGLLVIVVEVAFYFGVGGLLWVAASLLTRQGSRTR